MSEAKAGLARMALEISKQGLTVRIYAGGKEFDVREVETDPDLPGVVIARIDDALVYIDQGGIVAVAGLDLAS